MRAWARQNPPAKVAPEGSVAARLLAVEPGTAVVDFTPAASVLAARRRGGDTVARFPNNPQRNWGPKSRASGTKRKADHTIDKHPENNNKSSNNNNKNNNDAAANTHE